MLRLRVITALILGAVLTATMVFLRDDALLLFSYVFVFFGCCEWAKLACVRPVFFRVLFALSISLALYVGPGLLALVVYGWPVVVVAAAIFWVAASVLVACFPRGSFLLRLTPAMLVVGMLVLVGAWLALLAQALVLGTGHVVWLLLAICLADSTAYFVGRRFGRHQLAPAVNPDKTWEGLIGAAIAMLACSIAGAWFFDGTLLEWLGVGALVLVAGMVGDLFISALKRSGNHQRSGVILPGYGGVLDGIGSLLAAAPVFALLAHVLWSERPPF